VKLVWNFVVRWKRMDLQECGHVLLSYLFIEEVSVSLHSLHCIIVDFIVAWLSLIKRETSTIK
jgi:hypothetical protein